MGQQMLWGGQEDCSSPFIFRLTEKLSAAVSGICKLRGKGGIAGGCSLGIRQALRVVRAAV